MTPSSRRAWVVWLLAALLAMQTLGLLHRVVHARGMPTVVAMHGGPSAAEALTFETGATLFALHVADADCRLFDQTSHADMPLPQSAALTAEVPPDSPATRHRSWLIACQCLAALARGPPALS